MELICLSFIKQTSSCLSIFATKLEFPKRNFAISLEECGNTVSSSIPIALKELSIAGKLKSGQKAMLVGFGGWLFLGCGYRSLEGAILKNLIIVGAGGFGREVFHWLEDWIRFDETRKHDFQIKGFLSLDEGELDGFEMPIEILGDENTYKIEKDDLFVMGVGQTTLKKKNCQSFV